MMYKLCYVSNGIMYFTDDFKNVWGDDWKKSPYEHNASSPYGWSDNRSKEENIKLNNTHLRYLAFMQDWGIKEPCDGFLNSPYSVEDINNGAVAWLFTKEAGGLMAGATIEEAIEWCKKANIKCGELK